MSKHTPGPWTHNNTVPMGPTLTGRYVDISLGGLGYSSKRIDIWMHEGDEEEVAANTQLIVSAPDLFEENERLRKIAKAIVDNSETLSFYIDLSGADEPTVDLIHDLIEWSKAAIKKKEVTHEN